MRYATVCSGIEAPSQAWHGLGWKPVWFSEIEAFPSAVLNHHYPEVPNLGDMTKLNKDERYQKSAGAIDVFCGGTPCQSFSVAGLRKGLADPRGNLALHFLRIVDDLRPRWVVWENVPGVLSSNGGRDFGSFLGALGQLGYGFAYRVLDAQYFGVAQRRRRVFVVGYIGGSRGAAAVLFDAESLSGHPPPGREAGHGAAGRVAPCLNGNGRAAGSATQQDAENGALVYGIVAGAQCAGDFKSQSDQQAANGKLIATVIKGAAIGRKPENGPQYGEVLQDGSCYTLNCTERHAVAYGIHFNDANGSRKDRPNGGCYVSKPDTSPALTTNDSDIKVLNYWSIMPQNSEKDYKARRVDVAQPIMDGGPVGGNQGGDYVQYQHAVRRLTPRECERLQGFSDNFTRIPYRGKPASKCPDGPRYKALGNSMAVPVMRWIGERIELFHNQNNNNDHAD